MKKNKGFYGWCVCVCMCVVCVCIHGVCVHMCVCMCGVYVWCMCGVYVWCMCVCVCVCFPFPGLAGSGLYDFVNLNSSGCSSELLEKRNKVITALKSI